MTTETFGIAAAALAANPFTPARAALDLRLTGGRPGEAAFERAVLELERSAGRAITLGQSALDAAELERAFRAYLFALFHRYRSPMQGLIATDGATDEPTRAPFALEIVAELRAHHVPQARAERLVSLFYQTERAFARLRALAGPSPSMQRLRASLWNALFTHDVTRYEALLWDRMEDFSTLLLGETGTGKGAAAAALGHGGLAPLDAKKGAFLPAHWERFLAVNLAEVPDTLIESALFGHEKGAFTGAERAHDGIFARVPKHGAVFLDELGDIPLHVQVKLLRVLQDRTFTPLGSKKARPFLGRVIAATHRPLDVLRSEGRFRDDLYYRLSTEAIVLPTLEARIRESDAELPTLVAAVVERTLGKGDGDLSVEVLRAIERDVPPGYAWPGNVRELEQAVRQVLLGGRVVIASSSEARANPTMSVATARAAEPSALASLLRAIDGRSATGAEVLARYLAVLHGELGSYDAVAKVAALDRRTVKKHVDAVAGWRGDV